MRVTDRIASLHPAIVTLVFLSLFIGGGVAMNDFALGSTNWIIIYSVTMAITMAPIIAWHYSLYRCASDRSTDFVGHSGRRAFLFATCAIAMAVFLVTLPLSLAFAPSSSAFQPLRTLNSAAMVVACLSYFVSIWAAANALTRLDERKKAAEGHKVLGTFFLEFYLPIGIWFIYPRIKRAIAMPLSNSRLA